jgi:DNA-binding LytR/AlgR family response regulator
MSIRTLLIDDEQDSLERLETLLADQEQVEIVGAAGDGLEAIRLIDDLRPELIFLDIQMPGASGFEVLERTVHRPLVIFMTAYDEYAIRAFESNALDYILKPSTASRVAEAITRALDRRRMMDEQLLASLRAALGRTDHLKRFAVHSTDEILIIPEAEVFFFKAEEKCVLLCTRDEEHFIDLTLRELEERLDPEVFCRIHKSTIVAVDKVRKIHRWFHGGLIVELHDARRSRLKVGRRYRDLLRRRLNMA